MHAIIEEGARGRSYQLGGILSESVLGPMAVESRRSLREKANITTPGQGRAILGSQQETRQEDEKWGGRGKEGELNLRILEGEGDDFSCVRDLKPQGGEGRKGGGGGG